MPYKLFYFFVNLEEVNELQLINPPPSEGEGLGLVGLGLGFVL